MAYLTNDTVGNAIKNNMQYKEKLFNAAIMLKIFSEYGFPECLLIAKYMFPVNEGSFAIEKNKIKKIKINVYNLFFRPKRIKSNSEDIKIRTNPKFSNRETSEKLMLKLKNIRSNL